MTNISIIGAGIAGLTTAIALEKIGIKCQIFESAPTIRAVGAGLGLGANAIQAFQRLGLSEEIIPLGRLLPKFSVYDQQGKIITQTDSLSLESKYGADNFTIHRAALHQYLLSKIDVKTIGTNKKAIYFSQHKNKIHIDFEDGTTHTTDFLIVADGIHSAIRQKLLPHSTPRYAGYTCWRSVVDNSDLNIEETSESWGKGARFGIVPLANNQIYWFACVNAKQNDPNMKNLKSKGLLDIFKGFHQPIPQILEQTKDEKILWNDIIDLKPISKYAFDNILLIGDAAHATTPNLGQGACQAIEDAVVLAYEINSNSNLTAAFKAFENRRIKRTHFIVNTSWSIGKVAQLENPILTSLRDFAFRRIPDSMNQKQLEKLYKVDF